MAKEKDSGSNGFELTDEEKKALANETEGMQFITPKLYVHRPEIEGIKNKIVGILVGRRSVDFKDEEVEGGKRATTFYILSLTAPTILLDDDKKPFKGKVGDFALVCERYDLRSLSRYMPVTKADEDGVVGVVNYTKVSITPLKQHPIANSSRKVWKFDVRAMHVAPADVKVPALLLPAADLAPLPQSLEAGGGGGGDEDSIAF